MLISFLLHDRDVNKLSLQSRRRHAENSKTNIYANPVRSWVGGGGDIYKFSNGIMRSAVHICALPLRHVLGYKSTHGEEVAFDGLTSSRPTRGSEGRFKTQKNWRHALVVMETGCCACNWKLINAPTMAVNN